MKYFIKTIYLITVVIIVLFPSAETLGKDTKFKYSQEDVSNYFSGIVSISQNYTTAGYKYLNNVQSLKSIHSNFNIQFIRSLILLGKFEQAFVFAKNIWREDELFFEVDLLLGLKSLIEKDYISAEKYLERLDKIYQDDLFFDDFFGNVLLSWVYASKKNKKESFKFFDKIPERYSNLKNIQNSLLQCYFNTPKTEIAFEKIISGEKNGFSRYNFFLANYFVSKNEIMAAKIILKNSASIHNSNLLIKQANNFIATGNSKKIKNFFNCQNPKHAIAEIFYIVANLYSTQENYQLSNFYLKISLFLNSQFISNKTLLAENFFFLKKYETSKNIYSSLKSIGPVYSWYASKSIAMILSDTVGKEYSTSSLENEFNLLSNPNFENYYEIANFFKDNEYYEKSIKYYSLTLENIGQEHYLLPKILDRRGTSYEKLGNWIEAEKDLEESLEILPDQAHVLNYLAYSWVEKRINIDKALKMLIRANELRKNDGYIVDSLGWAHYVNKNYVDAEKFLQQAVEILPLDPVINDHYADTLWMVNKNLQARYFWKYILGLDNIEQQFKDNINKKLIFGVPKKL